MRPGRTTRGEALVRHGTKAGPAGRQIGMMQKENAVTQNGRMQSMFYSRLINGKPSLLGLALDEFQHFIGVICNLHATPFFHQFALSVNYKRAALDAANLFAVHILHFHHAELQADGLVRVGNQFERQAQLRFEAFVRAQRIAADAVDFGAGGLELRRAVRETRCSRWCSRACCPSDRNTARCSAPGGQRAGTPCRRSWRRKNRVRMRGFGCQPRGSPGRAAVGPSTISSPERPGNSPQLTG